MPRTAIQWTSLIATILVLALIFIGGLVRSTGAGLGCPDWPRCWGALWPPASAAEIQLDKINPAKIPAEYRNVPDPRVFFNKDKMWIEYLNRLWGVLSGFAVIAMVLASIRWIRKRPVLFRLSSLILVLMLIQGWLGALVVRSGLKQNMITIHMGIAMGILGLLILTTFIAFGSRRAAGDAPAPIRKTMAILITAALAATLVQIIGGTHVRELLDHVADTRPDLPRGAWIHQLGLPDHFHRAFSWVVLLATLGMRIHARKLPGMVPRANIALALVAMQLALGISLAYFALPPASQFLHLGTAVSLAAVLFRMGLDVTGKGS